MVETSHQITRLLAEAYDGRQDALDEVAQLVYSDLKRIAGGMMRQRYGAESDNLTMEPTALVNEAFLKLVKQRKRYDSRGHFFAIASRVMLRVLMDYDRSRRADKRGKENVHVSLSGIAAHDPRRDVVDIAAFVQAVERLESLDRRTSDVVKLRLLWGLTVQETADTLELSVRTVEREWRFGRRWLAAELGAADDAPEPRES